MYRQGDQCVLAPDSSEYGTISKFCDLLNQNSPNKHRYIIRDTYLNFGQNRQWTTIIDDTSGCQVLNPAQWLDIVNEAEPIKDLVDQFFNDPYCQDK